MNNVNDDDDDDDDDDVYLEGLDEWNKDYDDKDYIDYDDSDTDYDSDDKENHMVPNVDLSSSSYAEDSLNNNYEEKDSIQFASTLDGYVTYTSNTYISPTSLKYGASITSLQTVINTNNMSSPFTDGVLSSEANVVNLVLEMLLGNSNELFSLLPVPNSITRYAFSLTYTAKNIRTEKLSSTSLSNLLEWFACLGSYIRISREFSFGNYPVNEINNDTLPKEHINDLESIRAATIELLQIVEKELSLLNTDVTTERDRSDYNNDTIKLKPIRYERTMITLYCVFRQWSSFFESINAIIETLIAPSNNTNKVELNRDYSPNVHITSLIDEMQNCLRYLSLSAFPFIHSDDYSPFRRKKLTSNSIKQDYNMCIDFDAPKAHYNLYHGFNQLCYQFSIEEYLLKYTKDLYKGKGLSDDDLCSNSKGLESNKKSIPMVANAIDDCLTSCHLEAQIISSDNKKLQSFGILQKGIIDVIKGYKLQYPSRASDPNELSFETIETLEKGTQFKYSSTYHQDSKKKESKKLKIDEYLCNQSKESLRKYEIYDHNYPEICTFFSNIPMFKTCLNKKKSDLSFEEQQRTQKQQELAVQQQKLKERYYPEILTLQAYGCITPANLQLHLTISHPISLSLRKAYSAATKYTRFDYNLSQNILFLQQVYLLGQLDIFDPIRLAIETSFSNLNEGKNLGHDINLLSESLHHYVQQYIPTGGIESIKHMSITLTEYNNDDRLSLSSTSSKADKQNEIKLAPSLFNNLTIELHHTWPLSDIFNSEILDEYNIIMRFLVQLSSSKWAAERVWKKAMASDLLMMSKNIDSSNSRYADAQKRCRAGLGILMHSTGALYNFYISQVHMHILPSFNDYHRNQQYTLLELKQYHISILRLIRSLIRPIEKSVLRVIEGAYTAAKLLQYAVLFNENNTKSNTDDISYIVQKEHIFDVELAMLQLRSLLSEFTSELALVCKKNCYFDNYGNINNDDSSVSDRLVVAKLKGLLVTIGSI